MLTSELDGAHFKVTQEFPAFGKMTVKLGGVSILSTLGYGEPGQFARNFVMLTVIPLAYLGLGLLYVQMRHVEQR